MLSVRYGYFPNTILCVNHVLFPSRGLLPFGGGGGGGLEGGGGFGWGGRVGAMCFVGFLRARLCDIRMRQFTNVTGRLFTFNAKSPMCIIVYAQCSHAFI